MLTLRDRLNNSVRLQSFIAANKKFWSWNVLFTILSISLGIGSLLVSYLAYRREIQSRELGDIVNVFEVTIVVFGVYLFFIAFLLGWREFTYSRKARFAESTSLLHDIFHKLRHACCKMDDMGEVRTQSDADNVYNDIMEAVTSFADLFSLITRTQCRANAKGLIVKKRNNGSITDQTGIEVVPGKPVIQALKKKEVEIETSTFCRCRKSQKSEAEESVSIFRNTEFEELIRHPDKKHFFSNNLYNEYLSREGGYKNSNWPNSESPRNVRRYIYQKKYDYIASIVWPIRSRTKQSGSPQIIGFLRIDSKSRHVFDRRHDVDLGLAVSDALYHVIKKYLMLFSNQALVSQGD